MSPRSGRLFGEIEAAFGRLDCLVNNAAVFRAIDPLEASERDWDAIHSVNLKATFFCCQQAAKIMVRGNGGRIVNIASLGGLRPWAKHVPYCASKAGVVMLTHGLAKALAPKITVNGIAPGVIHFGDQMPGEIDASSAIPRWGATAPAKKSPQPSACCLKDRHSSPGKSSQWTAAFL